jgi:hypothetical protein
MTDKLRYLEPIRFLFVNATQGMKETLLLTWTVDIARNAMPGIGNPSAATMHVQHVGI